MSKNSYFAIVFIFAVLSGSAIAENYESQSTTSELPSSESSSVAKGCCFIGTVQKKCEKNSRTGKLECTGKYSPSQLFLKHDDSCGSGEQTTTPNSIVDNCRDIAKKPGPIGNCQDGKHKAGDYCLVNQPIYFLEGYTCVPSTNGFPSCLKLSTVEEPLSIDGSSDSF